MAPNFGFTKLVVADLEAMHDFYTAVFGLEVVARVEAAVGDRTIEEIMYHPASAGGASLVLLRFEDREAPASEEVILGFIADDVDALVTTVVDNGGAVVDAPHDMPEHGVRVGFATDPEGHLLELVQLLAPAAESS